MRKSALIVSIVMLFMISISIAQEPQPGPWLICTGYSNSPTYVRPTYVCTDLDIDYDFVYDNSGNWQNINGFEDYGTIFVMPWYNVSLAGFEALYDFAEAGGGKPGWPRPEDRRYGFPCVR